MALANFLDAGLRSSALTTRDHTIMETGMSSVTCTMRGFLVVKATVSEHAAATITNPFTGWNLRLITVFRIP
ncbi:Uncharacterised protein [Mycobacteroides abscessus subsp. massiliense]|nr:Uncharacterised protein [Mycobacteroides abscessus subsp. massiliense]